MSEPAERYFGEGDPRLRYFEWGDPADPVILLLHATGFHARCWDKVVAALPAGYRVIAVDHLGHGRSAKPDTLADWTRTAEPLMALVEGLELRNVIGAGHSMGGHCLVQMAARMGDRFTRLVLIDPVIMEPALYKNAPKLEDVDPSANPVSRRRAVWDSPEQMFERLREHPSYAIWQPDVLMDYCRHGLLRRPDGDGFELACPPLLEASVYAGSLCIDPYPMVDKVAVPVTILRAPPGTRDGTLDFTRSPTWPGLVERFADACEVYLPELTHFMPMQDPVRIAYEIVNTSPIS
ncbi:alpha/beta hydrolase [Parasphingopyxis algicola]|uniref:alpha/beta fold hydrolase n=1 Tax=Parasphingopyxis algicola TaxID=2026624 RepID=UPI0015A481F3|nr:alpha/beta hydrolase [Parasphingopyxis algicola]QLC24131.1 alpha/beta hydrolase [Parasphingopyxis algicola]